MCSWIFWQFVTSRQWYHTYLLIYLGLYFINIDIKEIVAEDDTPYQYFEAILNEKNDQTIKPDPKSN